MSDRVTSQIVGHDWSGTPIPVYFVSAAETIARLEDYQQRASYHRTWLDKVVVLITASIHATEVGGTQMIPQLLYDLAAGEDEAICSILQNTIVILAPSMNPGGLELVCEWYARTLGSKTEGSLPPFPDHPVGHDINRDWVMLSQPETRALHSGILRTWRPHIHFDLHQMQTNGPRYCLPPYIDPIDPYLNPALSKLTDELGETIANMLQQQGNQGIATRTFFDAFSPSRSYVAYHGGIRILGEAASARLATTVDLPRTVPGHLARDGQSPWPGGRWSLHEVVELHHRACLTLLEVVAQSKSRVLCMLKTVDEDHRSPGFGWLILPYSMQRDPGATQHLIDVLLHGEIRVERVQTPFALNGVTIPPGAFHVPPDQPWIAYANTLMEPTVYPGDQLSTPARTHVPYDVTAHTLPLLMGIDVLRLPKALDLDGEVIAVAPVAVGWIRGSADALHFAIPCTSIGSARIVNGAFQIGADCRRLTTAEEISGQRDPGTFLISGISRVQMEDLIRDSGIVAQALHADEFTHGKSLKEPNIGVYQTWMRAFEDAGWTTHVLNEFGFRHQVLRDHNLRFDNLAAFSAIILPSQLGYDILYGHAGSEYPEEFLGGIGREGVASLRTFVKRGGTLIALGSASDAALAIVPSSAFNSVAGLTSDEFQSPGAIVRLDLEPEHRLCWGIESPIAVMVTNTPVFKLASPSDPAVTVAARFPAEAPLLAGWIHGEHHFPGQPAILEVRFGKGRAYMFGCRPQFRGMTHSAYRLLFNAIYDSATQQEQRVHT